MHRKPGLHRRVRSILIALFALAIVFSFAPVASAQVGAGGVGGGGGGGGGSKSGTRGSTEKKPRPKRQDLPTVEPAAAREKLQSMLTIALTRGTATTPFLANLFDQASTGAVPASAQSRKALAEAMSSSFKGVKLEQDAAAAIAEPITMMINTDGIEAEELEAQKDPLKQALAATDLTDERVESIHGAATTVAEEQQNETVKKLIDLFDEIQKEGEAGEDKTTALSEQITALAGEEASVDETSITKLAEHLRKGLDNAQLTTKERGQLAWNIRAVLESGQLPPAQFQPMLNDTRSILKAGLVKQVDSQAIVSDLQSIHKSLASGAPPATPAPAAAPQEQGAAGEGEATGEGD